MNLSLRQAVLARRELPGTDLWMKERVSSSCTVSRSSGQTAALWESSFCLVANSSTHSPNANMSTLRVYWFCGFVPAGSTSAKFACPQYLSQTLYTHYCTAQRQI